MTWMFASYALALAIAAAAAAHGRRAATLASASLPKQAGDGAYRAGRVTPSVPNRRHERRSAAFGVFWGALTWALAAAGGFLVWALFFYSATAAAWIALWAFAFLLLSLSGALLGVWTVALSVDRLRSTAAPRQLRFVGRVFVWHHGAVAVAVSTLVVVFLVAIPDVEWALVVGHGIPLCAAGVLYGRSLQLEAAFTAPA